MKKEKPICGTIPYFGGEYHVDFDPMEKPYTSSVLSGYGDFPFDRYDVPVIDLRNSPALNEYMAQSFAMIDLGLTGTEMAYKKVDVARKLNIPILTKQGK